KARALAGLSKIEFYHLLNKENMCITYDEEYLKEDLEQIKHLKK
ncbi:hypothetical protein LCGC14_1882390, partial [marine sediment metagenome]